MRAGEAVVSWSCIHHLAIWSIHASEHCHRAPAFQRCTNKIFSFVNFSQSVGLRRFFQRGLSFLNVPPIKPPLSTSPLSSSFSTTKAKPGKGFSGCRGAKWPTPLPTQQHQACVHCSPYSTVYSRSSTWPLSPGPASNNSLSLSRMCIIQWPHTYLDFECGQQ